MSQRLIALAVFGWTLANAATNSARGNFHYLLGKEPSQWRVNVQPTADPRNTSVSYATLLGGTKSDHAAAVVADASGNFYVTGWTYSADFPVTPSAFKGTFTDLSPKTANAFVAKFDPAGALIYCTYVGGNRDDKANSIAVDHDGNAYITGQTASLDFPTTSGAIVANLADSYSVGVFVLKLSPAGDRLVYSTLLSDGYYVGDKGAAIAVDAAGNAVVTGTNNSEQFATTAGAATERSYGNFVAKLNASGTDYIFVTATTAETDTPTSLVLDSGGNVYVAGYTYDLTPRGPTAVQPTNARQTLFRTKDGGAHWSPPGPGLEATVIYAMAIDPQDGSIVYASGFGALGGLFRSTDRGDSWTALFTDLPVGKIIVDPRDSKHLVIFAGGLATEEYVSRDSGATWKHRGPVSARFSDLVNNMVFDPSRPQNAYATGLGGPFYSRDGGDTWVESMVYKPAFAPNPERWTLPIVDSSNPDTLYVSAVSNSLGVYRSTDAGLTWLFISAEGFTTMLAGPAGSGVLYGLGSGWPLCVSLDAGVTWTQRLLDLQIVFLNMVLDPVDHSLYLFASPGLYRSKDGGLTAEEVTDLPINPDVRALYFDPVNPGQWIALTNFGADAFVTKLSPDGGTTLFTTFLGGSREDRATAVALDKSGNILVTGTTNSRDFYGAQSDVGPGTNAFISLLSNNGATLQYSRFAGGSSFKTSSGIALDRAGNVSLAGSTFSPDFPLTADALQTSLPTFDMYKANSVGYYMQLDPNGAVLSASYLGGVGGYSSTTGIAIAPSGRVCIVGDTQSPDFPATPGATQGILKGSINTFLMILEPNR